MITVKQARPRSIVLDQARCGFYIHLCSYRPTRDHLRNTHAADAKPPSRKLDGLKLLIHFYLVVILRTVKWHLQFRLYIN